ncbi:MAG: metal ABC transporter permease [Synergistales bacterium]
MLDALQFGFMRNALIAGFLVSLVCGIIGTLVVANRLVFLAGGIAHSAYGGLGLALFFGFSPFLGAMGFSLAMALLLSAITVKGRNRADTAVGVLWAVGMALGVILVDLSPGYRADLMSLLFGSILTVSFRELWLMAGTTALVAVIVALKYRDLLVLSYDPEFASTRGLNVTGLHTLLLLLVAAGTVVAIHAVGLILVIALFTIPPTLAERSCRSLATMMVVSAAWSALFTFLGLDLSYRFNLTSGATIILVAASAFFMFSLWDAKGRGGTRKVPPLP